MCLGGEAKKTSSSGGTGSKEAPSSSSANKSASTKSGEDRNGSNIKFKSNEEWMEAIRKEREGDTRLERNNTKSFMARPSPSPPDPPKPDPNPFMDFEEKVEQIRRADDADQKRKQRVELLTSKIGNSNTQSL